MPARTVTAETLLDGLRLGQIALAPDGERLAFSVSRGYASSDVMPASRIWVGSGDGGAVPVTDDDASVSGTARWSSDGSMIAFLSDRESPGMMSLHLLSVRGGQICRLGQVAGSAEVLAWSRRDDALLAVAADVGSDRGGVATRIDDPAASPPDPRVVTGGQALRRLYRVEVPSGTTTEIGPTGLSVWDFDASDDAAVAVLSRDPSESGWYQAFLGVIDLRQGTARRLYTPAWQIANPRLSPNGGRAAFVEGICSDRGSEMGTVKVVDLETGTVTELTSDVDVAHFGWCDDGRLWYFGRRGMVSTCGLMSCDGRVEEIWSGNAVLQGGSASADGRRLGAVVESLSAPPEVCLLQVDEPERGWRSVTNLNASLVGFDLPPVERLDWLAPDGLPIQGLLVRPRRASDRPAPMVVLVHGGPTGSWSYAFPSGTRHAALLAEAGYAVLLPNPRGSSGRGQEFARAVVGDLGGAELSDILAGVDSCVAAGFVDARRIGIMGASHGGFIAAWAATRSSRFRASVAMACVSDYLSLHYTSNIGGLDDILFTGEDRIASYLERSPVVYASSCNTPILILHGEEDRCCPLGQAQELYGALVEAGVESELVVYPREGHGWVEREHQLDLWRRIVAWFDRHLGSDT
ncbi:MAG: S9 family peptidase [Actinomycetota bacterium]|nr:S9 family peptidase [Actinomycetota bacterium]